MTDWSPELTGAAEEAAAWFVRLNGETATGDDWLAFERWLASSPAHVEAYERLERLSAELDANAAAIAAELSPAPTPARGIASRPSGARHPRWLWPVAGAALAASVVLAVWFSQGGPPPSAAVYETPPGQVQTVSLADGSLVRLNAGSHIEVTLSRRERSVRMSEGEAAFDVSHHPARPFLIAVGDRQVRVVGTEFDLRRRSGLTTLTVRRGVVEVRPVDEPEAPPTRVSVGEQWSRRDGAAASRLVRVDADDAFGWTEGMLVYHARPLGEVAADLSLRFGASIRPADAQTAAIPFTGVLVTDNQAAVLRRLEAFSGVRAETSGREVILRAPHQPPSRAESQPDR